MSWEEYKKAARKIEAELELKLISYSKFCQSFAQSSLLSQEDSHGPSDDLSESMAVEIEQLLAKLSNINSELAKIVASGVQGGLSATHVLQLHREKLHQFTQEFRKTKASIVETKSHAELLLSVRNDISRYKSGGSSNRMDNLIRERASVHSSDRAADSILGTAQEARDSVVNQNAVLANNTSRINSVKSALFSTDSIMSAINRKKSRDCVILSVFIAFCICFLIWYGWM